MRAVGYIRVSSEQQRDNGCSLEAQEAKLRAYAGLYNLELVAIEVDAAASAKSLARPGLQRALDRLTTGQAEGLLVTKLDRLTRSVKDFGELIDRYFGKWSLLSVGDQIDTRTASGVLVLNILASVSQWERGVISERTKDALAHKKAKHERTGGVPYGWQLTRDGVHLDANAKEQAIIQAAHDLREQGLSLRQIGHELTEQGMNPRSGRAWHPESVSNLLKAWNEWPIEARS
jgi:site-specific DNA recombinase